MANRNEVYVDIAQKLGVPPSKRVITILESYFSPEEGEVIKELFDPITCEEVASRMGIDKDKVFPTLEGLTTRDVIKKGKTEYCFHSNITAFHHHTVGGVGLEPTPEKIKKAWGDFFFNEWSDLIVQNYIKRQAATGRLLCIKYCRKFYIYVIAALFMVKKFKRRARMLLPKRS